MIDRGFPKRFLTRLGELERYEHQSEFWDRVDGFVEAVGEDADRLPYERRAEAFPYRGFYLSGGYGGGKSTLACAAAFEACIEVGRPGARYYTASSIYVQNRDVRQQMFERAKTCNLLVLDDFPGSVRLDSQSFALTFFDNLFQTRYNRELCTIVTSNRSIESLREDADLGYIGSRLLELTYPVEIVGKDLRGRGGDSG